MRVERGRWTGGGSESELSGRVYVSLDEFGGCKMSNMNVETQKREDVRERKEDGKR